MNVAWILFALGLIVSLMTLLATVGVLKPNGLIGIRTQSTKLSPEAWKKGHASAARVTVPLSLLLALVGLLLALGWPEFMEDLGAPAAYVGIVILAIGTIVGARLAEGTAKDVLANR